MPRQTAKRHSSKRSKRKRKSNTPRHKKTAPRRIASRHWPIFEAEVLPGLEAVARKELGALRDLEWVAPSTGARGAEAKAFNPQPSKEQENAGELRFRFGGDLERLERLSSVAAVYHLLHFEVPRPRGLLGHEQFTALTEQLRPTVQRGGHTSLRLSAAGKGSDVMTRLAGNLAEALGLTHDAVEGELLLRLRPDAAGKGWEVLARLTPRPLSAREWRVCNREGGLNASVAYAALALGGMRPSDRVFNPMCGSGTLLIERALMGPYDALVGVDIDPEAVACAKANLKAAGRRIEVAQVDALNTGLPPRTFDLIVCDLPWGDDIGSHEENAELYPAFLAEMYRLCSKSGRMVVITHELKLFEAAALASAWRWRELTQVLSGGHWPKLYLLNKG